MTADEFHAEIMKALSLAPQVQGSFDAANNAFWELCEANGIEATAAGMALVTMYTAVAQQMRANISGLIAGDFPSPTIKNEEEE